MFGKGKENDNDRNPQEANAQAEAQGTSMMGTNGIKNNVNFDAHGILACLTNQIGVRVTTRMHIYFVIRLFSSIFLLLFLAGCRHTLIEKHYLNNVHSLHHIGSTATMTIDITIAVTMTTKHANAQKRRKHESKAKRNSKVQKQKKKRKHKENTSGQT